MSEGETINDTPVVFPVEPVLKEAPVPWEELAVAIDGPSEVKDLAMDEVDGKVSISFVANVIGPYVISIKYGDEDIDRTPITIHVHKEGEEPPAPPPAAAATESPSVNSLPKGRLIRFKLPDLGGSGTDGFSVKIVESPAPASSTKLEEDGSDLVVMMNLTVPGKYVVEVEKAGEKVGNSPYTINVPAEAFE
eukprot:TRINITY_DN13253_c0_g1_i1.p1 TRINITY_DN13253_c0_g1~~TRINITY_DN13253_c0_g1_i1.p1  ORF type:complete len:192 (-),score=69.66 TRINITY_DN13253_c0_g1_i1:167-742(-)